MSEQKPIKLSSFLHLVRPLFNMLVLHGMFTIKELTENITRQEFHIAGNISEHLHWCNIGDINNDRDILIYIYKYLKYLMI